MIAIVAMIDLERGKMKRSEIQDEPDMLYDLGHPLNYAMIDDERRSQLKKWHYQKHTMSDWLLFIAEEVGELAEAIGDYKFRDGDIERVAEEAVQVSTLANLVACLCKRAAGEDID